MVTTCGKFMLAISLALNVTFCIIIAKQAQIAAPSPVNRDEAASLHSPEPSTTNNTSQYWSLQVSDGGGNVACSISTQQTSRADNLARDMENKIIIHIHGMHHTGTGYLRKTVLNALNNEFSPSASHAGFQNISSASEPVACMHDSLLPFRHLYNNKTKLYIDHHKPEEEGQHLQTVYPSFYARTKILKEAKSAVMGQAPKIAYLADFCSSQDETENKRIGNILFEEWSRYWNVTPSSTFLIQKSPSLDVQFLEATKILPTLHIIITRHPMTSNSWGIPHMAYGWVMAYHHVLKLLNEGKVEWYAVLTYEALLEYHDEVMEDLIEVVRSGMKRFGLTFNAKLQRDNIGDSRFRRQLHLNNGGINNPKKRANLWQDVPSNSYLIPKGKSVEKWRECLERSRCRQVLARVTTDILPLFGYVSIQRRNASLVQRINDRNSSISKHVPLKMEPSPVTVSKQYGRVLFSSEGDAVKLLHQRKSNRRNGTDEIEYMGQPPPTDLVMKMAELLDNVAIKPKTSS